MEWCAVAVQSQRVCDWPARAAQPCGETVQTPSRFTVEDKTYEVDLCARHQEEFLALFERPIALARPVGVRRVSGTRKLMKTRKGAFTTKDVRAWLKEQPGYRDSVSDTGRIAESLIELYIEAHS
jgi:hypothetical protein